VVTAKSAAVTAKSYRREWIGFSTMSLGLFMAILDIQIVAAALPRIAQALHTPLDELSWVQTAYLITEVIAIAMSGRLARAMSTRWLFAAASFSFAATSLGCALSHDFVSLIVWRTLQGFAAGTIIPTVFAAGYQMFPKRLHHRAILIAGVVAMLAPSVGPFLGGYIAEKLTWNWLFLVNIPIAIVVGSIVIAFVNVDEPDTPSWKTIDLPGFVSLSICLASLQTLLKVAPEDHWTASRDYILMAVMLAGGYVFIRRCLGNHEPLVDFAPLRKAAFSAACAYNFVLGIGLFGSLYVLPLFLGFVRFHSPLEIGIIMTVMGVSQLVAAPFATISDRRLPPQLVVFIGFAMFGAGAIANAFQTPRTDYSDLLLPQILRGAALLFCILPITNVALESLPAGELSNASGLLNFMRNIGGAVGIGLVDTIVNVRPPAIAKHLVDQLVAGNAQTAHFVGVPVDLMKGVDVAHADPSDIAFVTPIIERAAATMAFNEAWILIGSIMIASLLMVPLLRRSYAGSSESLEPNLKGLTYDIPSTVA
jgi:DHA2 family multidrug resistance protein